MEPINKYSLSDDQGNLVRVSSHGPSIDDIEIATDTKKKTKKEKRIIKFVFHEATDKADKKEKNSRSLYFFGEMKNINFIFSERRFSRNIHVEMKMDVNAALNVIKKFKKKRYMCLKVVLPTETKTAKERKINNKNKLKRILQFSIIRIFGDKATVKVVVAQ